MRYGVGLTALLVGLALAGCLDGSDGADDPGPGSAADAYGPGFRVLALDDRGLPVPYLLCHAGSDDAAVERCNFEMTPDDGREGNEVTIAVNPTDPRNIVGGAKDYYPADAGQCVWDGVYVTHDGGRSTFEDRSFDGSPWRLLNGDVSGFAPNYASQFWCTTDPVAYFDVNGNLYYLLMAYQADPVTGSDLGEDVIPPHPLGEGALNDWAFNRAVQIIAVSSDGGDSFHTFTPVLEGTYPVNFHDKGWIAASHDGTIHVMWLAFFVPGNQYCRSTDGGQTYLCTEIIALQFLEAGQGSFLEVGTGDQVYASWYNGGIRLKRSMDTGATWDDGRIVIDAQIADMPGLSPRDRRDVSPMMATDRNPDSPFADAVYFAWQSPLGPDDADGSEVLFSASFDQGSTFSDPVAVAHSPPGAHELFPAISVSPGGVIDVSWMDTDGARTAALDGADHATFEQHYSYSLDGGKTWSQEASVRDAGDDGWDPALCHHQNGMIFIGDYNDIDSSWQAAHPVWPDSRDGVCDVYTATIQRPMFADGWDRAPRMEAEAWILDHPL